MDKSKALTAVTKSLKILDYHIQGIEDVRKEMARKEESFLNFISPKNTFGFSQYFSWNGLTYTGLEKESAERFLEKLYRFRAGARIYQSQVETGNFRPSRAVQEFLRSPFVHLGSLPSCLEEPKDSLSEIPKEEARIDYLEGYHRLVEMAAETGFVNYARTLNWEFSGSLGGQLDHSEYVAYREIVEHPLTSRGIDPVRSWGEAYLDTANSALSLPMLGAGAVGGGVAYGLKAFGAATWIFQLLEKLPRGIKIFLPGLMVFQGEGWKNAAANAGLEILKVLGYAGAGDLIGKEKGREAATAAVMVFGGFANGIRTLVPAAFVDRVLAGQAKEVAQELAARGLKVSDAGVQKLIEAGSQNAGMQSGKLAKAVNPKDVTAKLEEAFEEAVTFPAQAARESAAMAQTVSGEVVQTERALEEAVQILKPNVLGRLRAAMQDVLSAPDSPAKATALRRLRGDIGAETRRAGVDAARKASESATAASTTGPHAAPGTGRSASGAHRIRGTTNGNGNVVKKTQIPDAIQDSQALDGLVATPPDGLRMELVKRMTDGLVEVDARVMKALQALYEPANIRPFFWMRIKELLMHDFTAWKSAQVGNKTFYETTLGDWILRVEARANQFKLVEVVRSGS